MIRRTSINKATPSLVNAADQEHMSVTKAIKDTAPITDLNAVTKSINFDATTDGAYVLRDPLILKEYLLENSFFLYDKEHKFNDIDPEIMSETPQIITSLKELTIKFRYYDKRFRKYDIVIPNLMTSLNFIDTFYKHVNTQDSSLVAVRINRSVLDNWLFSIGHPSILYPNDNLNYGNQIYRLLKIFKDMDVEDTWIVELVSPELNTITSNLDTGNAESLDFNMLLDNPNAIRDLYDYGYNGTTKILAYAINTAKVTSVDTMPIYKLTESSVDGIRLIESLNTLKPTSNKILLKAFIATMKYLNIGSMTFYCTWEYSTNGGVDWTVCPQFVDKFKNTDKLITKNVSDITSSEFEKIAYEESLTKSADYIIEKQMVRFDQNMLETDLVKDRPDVLEIPIGYASYLFRFQVYVDTNKQYPKIEPGDNIQTSSFIIPSSSLTGGFPSSGFKDRTSIDGSPESSFWYQSYTCGGTKSDGKRILNKKFTITIAEDSSTVECFLSTGDSDTPEIGDPIYVKDTESTTDIYKVTGTISSLSVSGTSIEIISENFKEKYAKFNGTLSESELTDPVSTDYFESADPELYSQSGNHLLLHAGANSNCGNTIVINTNSGKYKIYAVEVTLGPKKDDSTYLESKVGCCFGSVIEPKDNLGFEVFNILAGGSHKFLRSSVDDTEAKQAPDSDVVTVACCDTEDAKSSNIINIRVYYKTISEPIKTTSTYLSSSTGSFSFKYSENTTYLPILKEQHEQLFKGTLTYYDTQVIINNKYNVFISNMDSLIFKFNKTLTFGTEVTKIIKFRSYLVIFTKTNINLAIYDSSIDQYLLKTLSTNIGLPEVDADTATVILNSIYFKNGSKIYKLVPNYYSADDTYLNIQYISEDILEFMTQLEIYCLESHNFQFSDAKYYHIFIPVNFDLEENVSKNVTYCLKYNYTNKTWTILKYPTTCLDVEELNLNEVYLRTALGICYFNKDAQIVLSNYVYKTSFKNIGYATEDEVPEEKLNVGYSGDVFGYCILVFMDEYDDSVVNHESLLTLYEQLPFADYHNTELKEINEFAKEHINEDVVEAFKDIYMPIPFSIDFGQKSSTYTVSKQFLESKLIFATQQIKDTFPITLTIETDGESINLNNNRLHIDANTDSALWKTTLNQKGTLNTTFSQNASTNFNGILRQLIVKYSGRGKTIRYLISGDSYTKFKFYSIDTRYRVLPKKQ